VDKVNGRKIGALTDLKAALQAPKDGVHLIEYLKGDSLQRMLLDAAATEASTPRVLQRYGIPQAEVIVDQGK
jgi:hypothetical protein